MTLRSHIQYSAISIPLLLPLGGLSGMGFFLSGSILIDLDHYIIFIARQRRLIPRGFFAYHERLFQQRHRIPYAGVFIFHTIEFLFFIGLVSFYIPLFRWLLAGLVFHNILDLFYLSKNRYLFGRAMSFIEHLIRVKKHRPMGYPYL
jgi:hypothetical protein